MPQGGAWVVINDGYAIGSKSNRGIGASITSVMFVSVRMSTAQCDSLK